MNISPIYCPDSGCFWSAHGIPDQYMEARDWHLAAHRAEEHGEPLTEEQIVYATRAGHVIPRTARTTAAAVAALGALPVPVGDEPQPLDDTRLAEIEADVAAYADHPAVGFWCCSAHPVADHVPALLAEVQRLKTELAGVAAEVARFGIYGSATSATKALVVRAGELVNENAALRARVAELEAERHSTNEALDDAVQALRDMRDRLAKYEQRSTDVERNALRQSFTELIAQAQEDRDYEGAFEVESQLRDREEQWKREDAANQSSPASKEA